MGFKLGSTILISKDLLLQKLIMVDPLVLEEYRERLNYKWGILDSYDRKALVIELIRLNQVDRTKVAILGNSAGGLTAINAFMKVILKWRFVNILFSI